MDNEILSSSFNLYRKDHTTRRGGVMLAASNKFFKLLFHPDNLELLTISLTFGHCDFIICLLYIPPNSGEQYHLNVHNYLQSLSDYNNLIVIGD